MPTGVAKNGFLSLYSTLFLGFLFSACGDSIQGVYVGEGELSSRGEKTKEDVTLIVEEVDYNVFAGELIIEGKDAQDPGQSIVVDMAQDGDELEASTSLAVENEKSANEEPPAEEESTEENSTGSSTEAAPEKCRVNVKGKLKVNSGILSGELCGTKESCQPGRRICIDLEDLRKTGELAERERVRKNSSQRRGSQ